MLYPLYLSLQPPICNLVPNLSKHRSLIHKHIFLLRKFPINLIGLVGAPLLPPPKGIKLSLVL